VCLAVLAPRGVSQVHGHHCAHHPPWWQSTWSPLHALSCRRRTSNATTTAPAPSVAE
jgi:hypothetical protein